MGAHSKRQAILLGLEDRRIDARDLLQVLERRELAVLRAVRDDRRGLRAPQRQAALQLDRRRRVHIDSRQLLRRKAGREILEHGPELLVRAPGASALIFRSVAAHPARSWPTDITTSAA